MKTLWRIMILVMLILIWLSSCSINVQLNRLFVIPQGQYQQVGG